MTGMADNSKRRDSRRIIRNEDSFVELGPDEVLKPKSIEEIKRELLRAQGDKNA